VQGRAEEDGRTAAEEEGKTAEEEVDTY